MADLNNYDRTHAELLRAFDLVADPDDWRAPIRAFCRAADVKAVQEAVTYFTATTATAVLIPFVGQFYITAVGYRAGPAGDR